MGAMGSGWSGEGVEGENARGQTQQLRAHARAKRLFVVKLR